MTEAEGLKIIKALQSAYPRQEFAEDTIRVYCRMLADMPYQVAQRAVYALIATSKWLPTVAEIREKCVELGNPLPHVEEAYEDARWAVRRGDSKGLHPLVKRAIDVMGGVEGMGHNELPEPMWHEWRRVYQRLREREEIRLRGTAGALTETMRPALVGETA